MTFVGHRKIQTRGFSKALLKTPLLLSAYITNNITRGGRKLLPLPSHSRKAYNLTVHKEKEKA